MDLQYPYKVQFRREHNEIIASMRITCNNSPYVIITNHYINEKQELQLQFDLIQSEERLVRSIGIARVEWRLPNTVKCDCYSIERTQLQPDSSELAQLKELGGPFFRHYGEPAEKLECDLLQAIKEAEGADS